MALAEEHLAVEGQEEEGGGLFLLGPLLPRACKSPTSLFFDFVIAQDVECHDGVGRIS